jgi:hypothetical protein
MMAKINKKPSSALVDKTTHMGYNEKNTTQPQEHLKQMQWRQV